LSRAGSNDRVDHGIVLVRQNGARVKQDLFLVDPCDQRRLLTAKAAKELGRAHAAGRQHEDRRWHGLAWERSTADSGFPGSELGINAMHGQALLP
jgi:hypothetical protein